MKADGHVTRDLLDAGHPGRLAECHFAVANLFIQSAVNSFDTVMVEGNSAAANADALVYDMMAGFYLACTTFMGQNYGAHKKDRVMKSYLICLSYAFVSAAVVGGTAAPVRQAVPVPVRYGCAGHRGRYEAASHHGLFLLRVGLHGQRHCRLPGLGQDNCADHRGDSGLLRVPDFLGLHDFCSVPYDFLPCTACTSAPGPSQPFWRRCISCISIISCWEKRTGWNPKRLECSKHSRRGAGLPCRGSHYLAGFSPFPYKKFRAARAARFF